MKLSVVIVNYNVKFYVEQCLRSVEKALAGIDAEVFVVDNHSHDGSADYLRQRFPHVRLIESNHNLGFARANNIAIRQSQGEYVLLLNPDTIVGEDTLSTVLTFADTHPRSGAIGVQMLTASGQRARESRRGIPTPMTAFYKMTGLCNRFPRNRRFGKYYMGHLPWEEPGRIEVVSGAFCLLRRSALNEVGLLDEDFFMYGEDIDLSYRLLKGGYENWYVPARILHYKGESTQKSSFRYVHVFYNAMLIFFRKHFGHLGFWLGLPVKLGIYAMAVGTFLKVKIREIRQSMGFANRRQAQPRYVFEGSQAMRDECARLAKRKGLCVDDAEDGESRAQAYIYKVYDTDTFSYEQIFDKLIETSTDTRDYSLGTYSMETKALITLDEIIL